jgi:NMD protein affecting ribosome stability and mRNA decay
VKRCKCGREVKTTGNLCDDCLAESYQHAVGSTVTTSGFSLRRELQIIPRRNEGDGWRNPPKDIAS